MKPPEPGWRPWLYAAMHVAAGPVMLAFVIWLLLPVRNACPRGHERFCLELSGRAQEIGLWLVGAVVLGFVVRSAIRNFKGSAAGISIEAESHRDDGGGGSDDEGNHP